MTESSLRRLFQRVVFSCLPLPLTATVACGGKGRAPCAPLPCPSGSPWNDVTCACAIGDAGDMSDGGDVPHDVSADPTSDLPSACLPPPVTVPPIGCGGGINYCTTMADADITPFGEAGGYLFNTYDGGSLANTVCAPFCPRTPPVRECQLLDPETHLVACFTPCEGRRPAGLRDDPCDGNALGRHFGEMAFFEAASVHAFRVLRRELHHYGAPGSLLGAAERAARDEVRHARAARRLARRHGTRARNVRVDKMAVRTLEAIAIENAVEGCVRETYGALLATYQAHASEDRTVRAVLTSIAKDETRHAALAWKVASWLDRRLDLAARKRVRQAQRTAARELLTEVRFEPAGDVVRVAGMPRGAQAVAMVEQLMGALSICSRDPDHPARPRAQTNAGTSNACLTNGWGILGRRRAGSTARPTSG